MAIAIVYEAESKVKLVAIEPKRLSGNSILLKKGTSGEMTMPATSRILGSHTANTNTDALTISARTT